MVEPFATAADLSARGVAVTDEALAGVLLADASETLRGELGWQVYPAAEVTVTRRGWVPGQLIHLPGSPIRSVSAVTIDGTAVDPVDRELVDGVLELCPTYPDLGWTLLSAGGRGTVAVTYTVGWDAPPAELVTWTCVLAAQALAQVQERGTLGAAPAAEQVDDYRVQFSAQQQAGELPIPERVLERLRSRYGHTAFVT